eukprot:scaffold8884_cov96-Skeletonema_menzelii.AAC.1
MHRFDSEPTFLLLTCCKKTILCHNTVNAHFLYARFTNVIQILQILPPYGVQQQGTERRHASPMGHRDRFERAE